MSNPVYFTVVADFRAFIEDASSDSDYDPQIVPVGGTVTFTPLVNAGDVVLATQTSPRPIGFIPSPVTAIIDPADGRLKLRKTADSGASGSLGFAPVRLLADSAVLELDSPLFYSVSFSDVVFSNNRRGSITGFTFQAPNSDTEINLITVARQPGQPASGITKIAPGAVRLASNGTDIIFSFAGVDLDEPVSLAGVTGPTGATGAAATIAVGTVQTGSPGSNATVTNSGSSGAAVFNFTIPRGDVGATGAQGPTGAQGIQGQPGVSLDIQGTVSTYANLPSNPVAGDAYLVASEGLLYYFDGTSWPSAGNGVAFVGPQGPVGAQGIQGIQGQQGIQGPVGASGPVGATGAAATVAVGTVQTGSPGSSVTVTNSGSSGAAVLDFTIPRGDVGATGPAGQAANILGSVATYANLPGASGLADGDAYVVAADGRLYIFDGSAFPADGAGVPFVGPAGATGPAGPVGATGASGLTGGTGAPGTPGASGAPGTTSWNGITDKPSTFTPSAHTHVAADISDSSAVGRSVLTAADAAAARSAISAENTASKGAANGYASLDSNGRVPAGQLPNSIMTYNGLLDVPGNSPVLSDATGDAGDVYRISVAGTRNFGSGNITLEVGDYLIHSGSVFQKADTTDAVSTVAGRTGDVVLTKSDVGLGNVDNTADANKAVLSASRLTTARTINGVSFDGTANITLPAGINRSVQTITAPTTLGAAANTDYVYFLSSGISTTTSGGAATYVAATGMNNWNYNGSAAQTKTFTHTTGSSNYVLLFVHSLIFFNNGTPSATATFDGVPMTLIQPRFNCANEASGFLFGLSGNFSGSYTVSITMSGYNQGFRATSIAATYGNVISVETPVTGSTSVTVNSAENVVAFSGSRSATSGIALSGSTSRLAQQDASGSGDIYSEVIDVLSTSTANRTVTTSTGGTVGLVAVKLNAGISTPGTPTLPTAVGNTNQYTLKNITDTPITVGSTSSQTIDIVSDANANSVVALFNGNGSNGSTSITESSGKTSWTNVGVTISTAQSKFGGASMYFNGSAYLQATSSTESLLTYGINDYVVEMWFRATSLPGFWVLYDQRPSTSQGLNPLLYGEGTALKFFNGTSTPSVTVATDTWYHVAFGRSGGVSRLFLNGSLVGSAEAVNTSVVNNSASRPRIGLGTGGNGGFIGWIDDLRITSGTGRYSANFSVPAAELSIFGNTLLPQTTARLISDGSNWRTV